MRDPWLNDPETCDRVCNARNAVAKALGVVPELDLFDALAALGIIVSEMIAQVDADQRLEVADGWAALLMSGVRQSLGKLNA